MPFPLLAIPLLAQAGMGAYQLIKGQSDASKLTRPTYEIPEEIKNKLSDAQRRTVEGLPEASKKLFVDNMQRASAFGLRNLSSRQAGIQGLAGLVDAQTQQGRQLAAQDATQRLASQEAIRNAIGAAQSEMAGYKEKAFDVNQMQPYMQKAQAAQALTGAGLQNIAGAVQGGISAYGQKQYTDALKQLYAGKDKTKDILNATETATQGLIGPTAPSDFTQPEMGTGSFSIMGPNLPGTEPALTGPTTPSDFTQPLMGAGNAARMGPNLPGVEYQLGGYGGGAGSGSGSSQVLGVVPQGSSPLANLGGYGGGVGGGASSMGASASPFTNTNALKYILKQANPNLTDDLIEQLLQKR